MDLAKRMVLKDCSLPLDVLTALIGHSQNRERNVYPDTGESGETYDVEFHQLEPPTKLGGIAVFASSGR